MSGLIGGCLAVMLLGPPAVFACLYATFWLAERAMWKAVDIWIFVRRGVTYAESVRHAL